MSKKTLVIILLALLLVVVLFVVSLSLGAREPGSRLKFDPKSPSLARIANWLSRPAKAENLTLRSGSAADCRLEDNRITVQAGATCIYAVAADRFWTRQLRLRRLPSEGGDGRLDVILEQTLPDQKEPLMVDQSLDAGKEANQLDIYARKNYAATLKIQTRGIPFFDPKEYIIEIMEQ